MRLEGMGDTASDGTKSALVLTFTIAPEETILASQRGNENKTVASNPNSLKVQTPPANNPVLPKIGTRIRRLRLPRSRAALIIGLVVLIILASSGIFYFKSFNFIQKNNLLNAAIANPYPPGSGTLALNDPLSANSLGYFWSEGTDSGASCSFSKGAYDVLSSQQGRYRYCVASTTNFSNFAYEVQTTIVQGDEAGIVFCVNDTNHTYYFFGIDSQGNYTLGAYNGIQTNILQSGNTSATNTPFNTGLAQANLLGVVAINSQITLYVNHQSVTTPLTDTTYSQGEVGVAVLDNTNPTEAVFTNAKVWTF
jgi:hypothetical protein